MTLLTKSIGLLLLLGASSSCASTNLYAWASEKAPRSEVLGFVDRGGDGDSLLIRMNGEKGHRDGVYELPVAAAQDGCASSAALALVRLEGTRETQALAALHESRNIARLDTSDPDSQSCWLLLDGFDSVDGSLQRIVIPQRRYYLSDEGQVKFPAGPGRFTKVAVHAQRTFTGPYETRGAAFLPPARRVPRRQVAGVAAAPLAVAVDVVTSPIQLMALLIMGDMAGLNSWHGISFEF